MELNKSLKKLHSLFVQYAPAGAVLLDFKQYENEYIVLCRKNDENDENCAHYAILRLNLKDSSYQCCYYANVLAALINF